jgi:predicted nucleic acid-binding protein
MSQLVIDASVAAKWFLPENDSDKAIRLLDGRHQLLAPDLIYAEYGNILWKQHTRASMDPVEAAKAIERFLRVPLQVHPSQVLLPRALSLAIQTRRTVYDCLYLALAMDANTVMVTADRRLVNALADGPLGRYVRGLGDVHGNVY